ncbi:MAG: KH domain-containing protein [Clostridia bacterium]|jgi:Predicted RNA-binding protein (contains KH domain)|nr:KH domain-containing protein [Clostridia bacterium]
MTELVEYLVKELVDSPDEVKVSEDGEVINVSVAKSDMGKIIGKQGRIAKSIRAIVKSVATKQGKKCTVEILEAE